MKLKFFFLTVIFFNLMSCDTDADDYEFVTIAAPEIMSKAAFRSSVDIVAPQNIKKAGKIYAYNDYIFVNDINKGVHIIDNTNPKSPKAIKYIRIPGNEDISIKDNYLYADSATDLLVFDISNINSVSLVERLEDVFTVYNYNIPEEAQEIDYVAYNYQTDIIVGWTIRQERRKIDDNQRNEDFVNIANAESNVGKGGSLARFQIVKNYLYTVGSHEMSIFNIENLAAPSLVTKQGVGWNIETMFQAEEYLYLGSTIGMFIYSLENPAAPTYVSDFTHWEGCDPVVVDGDYAYLTLRGGNLCGQDESVLEVIDISDKTTPTLVKRYVLDNPYGLGIKGNTLFVCDGTAGLKLFNKADPLALSLVETFKNIQAKDVIPLDNVLLMIGSNTLYQYQYLNDSLVLISEFVLK